MGKRRQGRDDDRTEMNVVRHVERDEQLKFGSQSSGIRVCDSRRLPIITPDIKGKSIDPVCQSQRDVSTAS
jgi:hypothetical protein